MEPYKSSPKCNHQLLSNDTICKMCGAVLIMSGIIIIYLLYFLEFSIDDFTVIIKPLSYETNINFFQIMKEEPLQTLTNNDSMINYLSMREHYFTYLRNICSLSRIDKNVFANTIFLVDKLFFFNSNEKGHLKMDLLVVACFILTCI